ncbi:MAG TPA: ABC transporter permease [Bacilli bacterium]
MILIDICTGGVRAGTSVLYASLGELIAERAGVINLGTEGSMLSGALGAFAVTAWTGNPWLGILAGGAGGALTALVHAFLVITRNANQLASGLTVMFFAMGVTAFLGRGFVSKQIHGFEPYPIPLLSDIPVLGPILFNHDVMTYFSFILVPLLWLLLFKSRWGIIVRATGEREEVVYAYGFSPKMIRYLAVIAGGCLAGIGGAQLSIAYTHTWVENMTAGKGIIAVALVIFASWRPSRAMLGAYLFGGAQALQIIVQQNGYPVSPFLLLMTPYVLTLIALYVVERRQRSQIPEGLSKVFTGSG